MSTLSELKKNRKQSFAETQAEVRKLNKNEFERDPRFWTPTFDKAQHAQALIRFLPKPRGETSAVIKVFNHWFKGPNGWYKENCRTTIDLPDPAQELTKRLYEVGSELAKDKARDYGRKKKFMANILVKRDPMNQKAEGGVFLYEFPTAIYDLIDKAMVGTEADDKLGIADEQETWDVFSFWDAKDFKLDITKNGNFNRYDNTTFVGKFTDVASSDEEIEAIWAKQHSLQAFRDEKNFKDYETLKKQLFHVLGVRSMDEAVEFVLGGTTSSSRGTVEDDIKTEERNTTRERRRTAPVDDLDNDAPVAKAKPAAVVADNDVDDDESYLDELMNEKANRKRGR